MDVSTIYNSQKSIAWYLLKDNSLKNTNHLQAANNADLSAKIKLNQKLQSIDSAVKAHEKTHLLVLGPYARGTIQYDYVILPGGQKYAVGGSIGVDIQPVPGNPQATIHKARIIRIAALGPNNPSTADKRIAVKAYQMEMQAQRELEKQKLEQANPEINLNSLQNYQIIDEVIPEVKTIPGNPEATLRSARAIRREIYMRGMSSSANARILIESYRIEKQAQQQIEEKRLARQNRIDVYA